MIDDTGTHGDRMRAAIIATGLTLWRIDPATVSARRIGKELGKTHGAILHHFDGADGLKRSIADEAVRVRDAVIVPMLITAGHPAAAALSDSERRGFLAGC